MIAIIDAYGGNIASVEFALERLGKKSLLTIDPNVIQKSSHVILPGVASAKQSMAALEKFALIDTIRRLKQPVLGICLGMQILFEHSEEGDVPCLGIIPGKISHFKNLLKQSSQGSRHHENRESIIRDRSSELPVPHMGWNELEICDKTSPLLAGLEDKAYFYYVHSYAAPITENTIGKTEYAVEFTGVAQKDNFFGTQFHPERSGKTGEKLLKNFIEI